MRAWWRAVVPAVVLLAAIDCSATWADGYPASDVLLSQASFLPADAEFSASQRAGLNDQHLAGTTLHYITHTEASILIDPAGYERALFLWPFSPQDVLATLRQPSRS